MMWPSHAVTHMNPVFGQTGPMFIPVILLYILLPPGSTWSNRRNWWSWKPWWCGKSVLMWLLLDNLTRRASNPKQCLFTGSRYSLAQFASLTLNYKDVRFTRDNQNEKKKQKWKEINLNTNVPPRKKTHNNSQKVQKNCFSPFRSLVTHNTIWWKMISFIPKHYAMQKHKMVESISSERLPSTWRMSADTQSGWTAATTELQHFAPQRTLIIKRGFLGHTVRQHTNQ